MAMKVAIVGSGDIATHRKFTSLLNTMSVEQLAELTKVELDKVGIPYEEKPGGFGDFLPLNPGIFEEEPE